MAFGFGLGLWMGQSPAISGASSAFTHFRVRITATAEGTYSRIGDLAVATSSGGAALTLTSATATSSLDGTHTPDKAINGVALDWISSGGFPQELIVQLPSPMSAPFEFRIHAGNPDFGQSPGDFTIDGSTDGGSTFPTTFVTRTGVTFADDETKTFVV
jgi:hypothetical protein